MRISIKSALFGQRSNQLGGCDRLRHSQLNNARKIDHAATGRRRRPRATRFSAKPVKTARLIEVVEVFVYPVISRAAPPAK
jgi:hypothetical protein